MHNELSFETLSHDRAPLVLRLEPDALEDVVEGGGDVGAEDEVVGVGAHQRGRLLDGGEVHLLQPRAEEEVGVGLDLVADIVAATGQISNGWLARVV